MVMCRVGQLVFIKGSPEVLYTVSSFVGNGTGIMILKELESGKTVDIHHKTVVRV
jgi:hypothetical protein